MKNTSNIPSFLEDKISQIPALQVLQNLGYEYINPEEIFRLRGSKHSNVILDDILEKQLGIINSFSFKGKDGYKFSHSNISNAIGALKDVPYDGLVKTNEKIYDLICLGKSFEETITGETKSFTLKYIDWENIENNVFHVTAEFGVERAGTTDTRRPDIILFVNGIPLVVIECKRPDIKDPAGQAVSQNIGNQRDDEIPRLFVFSQLLLGISPNEAKYGTVATPAKFWMVWKEKRDIEQELGGIINTPLSPEKKAKLFSGVFAQCRGYFERLEAEGDREVREQDRALYYLCRPQRLLELTHRFIVFDAGEKKIARYQQYFAVKNSIARITTLDKTTGRRNGGVIWHTQGSGKSITMVMLAKAIALDKSIDNPRIAVVTDRINLDKQIHRTFEHCGKEPVRARTGRHLIELIEQQKETVITTVIDKFDSALNTKKLRDKGKNIFVLVDESHRSQYGSTHTKMRKVFPNACYIGFTGTPLLKKDKSTAAKFGGFIDPKYTIEQAVEDKSVLRLLYEGRHAVQEVEQKSIDLWFDRISKGLSEEQKADLKRKFSRADHLNEADQKIYRIAYDIGDHFKKSWQGTGLKGQLVTPSKPAALKYKKYLDEFGMVSAEILISGPDAREDNEDVYEEPTGEVRKFWKVMMDRYGSEEKYNEILIDKFKHEGHPEIIIVVSKLLTGFDAPKNTVLYITKNLKEHSLLQAIARVNRLCEGKEHGYILDYYGILGDLNQALSEYQALADFDPEDIEGTITNVWEEVKTLKQKHSALWDIFKTIANKMDEEAYEQLLADEELRQQFYKRLSEFARTLKIALSTVKFIEETPEATIEKYKKDLHFFQKLRVSIKKRYAEEIDYKEYETKIQKLIDTYIKSDDILKITPLVDIFDKDKFEAEVNKVVSPRARADTIANRTKKTILEKWEEDPAFYKRFSRLLEETIEEFMAKRLSDAEYLDKVTEIMNSVRNRTGDDVPAKLEHREVAKAFYGLVYEVINKFESGENDPRKFSADVGLMIDDIVQDCLIVDWINNKDIQNTMLNKIEEYLYTVKDQYGIELSFDDIDTIMEQSLNVAKTRYAKCE
jgi:type I restriction enzyme R subunit